VLKTVGQTDEAVDCFQQAIELEPMLGESYRNLANLKTYEFSPDEITSMQRLINTDEMQGLDKVLIQFALGKALEDAKQYAPSFKYYQSANRGYLKIRPVKYTNQNARLKSFFSAEYFSVKKEQGSDSDAPIFVVGLPRSGSTLVEQILSSHSLVDGTMEITEITSIARGLNDPNRPGNGKYPQSIANLTVSQVKGLARRYLDYVQPLRQQAPFFIDKLPANFHHIGLIKTLLPNAKIIDIRRNPMASGWSQYKHFFAEGFLFSYDLATIGQYYNDYLELMDHWQAVLPGQILTINYEDLVNDLPSSVDTLLAYCGLKFEEACLEFHLNKRAVATASSEQVRQPLYDKALEHWRNYEAFLLPLKHIVSKSGLPGNKN
jgi:tetratricopeptide (TPR) repeat protein